MIENDRNQPIQQAHMEAADLLAQAIEKASRLGFSLITSGTTVTVVRSQDWPISYTADLAAIEPIFECNYLTNLIDWLNGVDYGRTIYWKSER